jgi:multidrug efflux pump subunit AcrA (membrane-fusion protein)
VKAAQAQDQAQAQVQQVKADQAQAQVQQVKADQAQAQAQAQVQQVKADQAQAQQVKAAQAQAQAHYKIRRLEMAVNYNILDNSSGRTRTISVDFLGNILAADTGVAAGSNSYYFSFTTGARDTDGNVINNVLSLSLDELVLKGVKQRRTDTSSDYTSITDMVEDYLYDFVNGHAENLHSSGVSERPPMQF